VNKEATEPSDHTASPEAGGKKLPYQKPAFRYEGVFETTALACGKISTTQAQCRSLLKTS
jgi:hypothetical protein